MLLAFVVVAEAAVQPAWAEPPAKLQEIGGSCPYFNNYLRYTGVAVPDEKNEPVHMANRAGRTIAPEYEFEWDGLTASKDAAGQHCFDARLKISFEPRPPAYAIKWTPPFAVLPQCRDEIERFDDTVRVHEGMHQDDDEALVKAVNDEWHAGKAIRACAAGETEAAEAFKQLAAKTAWDVTVLLGQRIEAKGEVLHQSEREVEPLDCSLCKRDPKAALTGGTLAMRAKIAFDDRRSTPMTGASRETTWKLIGHHTWTFHGSSISLLTQEPGSKTYRLVGPMREHGSGEFFSLEKTESACWSGGKTIALSQDEGKLSRSDTVDKSVWDITIRDNGTYSFILPTHLIALAKGKWANSSSGCGAASSDKGDRNGQWTIKSSRPPYTPIEGAVAADGSISDRQVFHGNDPYHVSFGWFNPHPNTDATFPLVVTVEVDLY